MSTEEESDPPRSRKVYDFIQNILANGVFDPLAVFLVHLSTLGLMSFGRRHVLPFEKTTVFGKRNVSVVLSLGIDPSVSYCDTAQIELSIPG